MTTQTVNLNLKISDFLEINNLLAELPQIVTQLESCGYECQAGRLEMNTAFIRMKEVLSELESGLTQRAVDAAKVCPECDGAVEFCAMGHYVPSAPRT